MVMIMIKQITIENFKSIKYANFKFKDNHDIVCLIGKTVQENQMFLKLSNISLTI